MPKPNDPNGGSMPGTIALNVCVLGGPSWMLTMSLRAEPLDFNAKT
jgi:hypothetical protein